MQLKELINKYNIFFFIIILIFLYLTNNHFDYDQTLIFGGADGASYLSISEDSPLITSKKIQPVHSERFFFPYVIGIISKILNIEIFLVYKIFVLIILFFINLYLFKILQLLKVNQKLLIVCLFLVNFNPYITRFYIAVPTIINDLIFIFGILLIIFYLIEQKNNKLLIFLGYILSFGSRQSSIALIITFFLTKFKFRIIYKKKNIAYLGVFVFFIFIFLNYNYSKHTLFYDNQRSDQYSLEMRLFGFFLQDSTIKEKLTFLILPFLSFAPLVFFFLVFRKFIKPIKNIVNSKILFSLFVFSVLIILQPILSGTEVTGRNVIRLTTLTYIPILILLLKTTKDRNINFFDSNITYYIFCIFVIFYSFHPTFSKITLFNFLRF